MPLIWCSISGHGFGHAAQVVPVLDELGRRIPDLKVILRTTLPAWFFQDRLRIEWELSESEQDIGCIQQGPLHIDVERTWSAYERFHRDWKDRVGDEAEVITQRAPHLILSDISYLALEAGARANIPCVGLSSICWDQILDHLQDDTPIRYARLLEQIQDSYRLADAMIRVAPSIAMPAFRRTIDVSAIAGQLHRNHEGLRKALGASPEERIVAIAFGGVPLTSLPWDRIEATAGYRFIVPGPVPGHTRRIVSSDTVPTTFRTIMASCDLLLTKPGYGTIVEAVASGTPVVYVRRHNFADEESLIAYLQHYGRGAELSAKDFRHGVWKPAMEAVMAAAPPNETAPPATGAAEAADILMKHMG